MAKLNSLLAGAKMTAVAAVFLIIKLVLQYGTDIEVPLWCDPAWVAVAITGIPLLYLAVWRMIHNPGISKISSALLIVIGMAACILMTVIGSHDELFAAGEIGLIMSIGALLEDRTTEHARSGLRKLISLTPQTARRIVDGKEEEVPVESIAVGDVIRVLPGETIPVDAVLVEGSTAVDQSVMTGESLPVDKAVGDRVFSGTLNGFGPFDARAVEIGEDSSLQKLIRLVKEADEQKAPIARIADQVANWLVPLALAIAIITWLVTGDAEKGITILVVFCPCALILATPTAIMAGIGQATKHGVIIKSGEALEKMGRIDTIAFDKTGTLTYGKLTVSDVEPFGDNSKEDVLTVCAAVESRSEHPLGKAVTEYAKSQNIDIPEPSNTAVTAGKGLSAVVGGKKVICGNERFVRESGTDVPADTTATLEKLRSQGKATIVVAVDGNVAGVIGLSDVMRDETPAAVRRLEDMGVRTVLLTGDHKAAADYFAEKAGVTEVHSELMPEEKVRNVSELMEGGSCVCMVGDGVNDAPALKTAYIGVAMGGMGSDIAIEAADAAIVGDDISRVPYLKRLANATVFTIKASIAISLVLNALAITFSIMGVLNPTTGALWHNVGSCLVILLAASLYDRKLD